MEDSVALKIRDVYQGVEKVSAGYKMLAAMGWQEGEGLVRKLLPQLLFSTPTRDTRGPAYLRLYLVGVLLCLRLNAGSAGQHPRAPAAANCAGLLSRALARGVATWSMTITVIVHISALLSACTCLRVPSEAPEAPTALGITQ